MYLLLLMAAVFTSCKKDDVGELAGTYGFVEQGTLTLAGSKQNVSGSGTYIVHRIDNTTFTITGDVEAYGFCGVKRGKFELQDDQQDIDGGNGMVLHFQNSYSEGTYDGRLMSWKTNSIVTTTYGGVTIYGTFQSTTKAVRK